MISGIRTITVPVKDLTAAKAVYSTLLGTEPYVDEPYYVGYRPEGAPEIGLNPNGHASGMTGPVTYFTVPDIEAAIAALVAAGAQENESPKDVGGGMLVGSVRDADGNVTGLTQLP
jgi:predicted enzyme related to lactoylglutathione lyase